MYATPAITANQYQKAEKLKYVQLFDSSVNQCYFTLLKQIIIDNITCFANIEAFKDTKAVKNNLNVINKARRCPDHSYTENSENWSWERFLEFRESIKWLEEALALFD